MHIRDQFLTTRYLHSGTAAGLYDAFGRALKYVDLEESKSHFIGFGCDGTNVNIAEGGSLALAVTVLMLTLLKVD